jgi:hypothetical protein
LTVACSEITGDLDRVVAIEYIGSTAPTLEEGDTLRLRARAISARGDTVPDAELWWALLDIDSTGNVGFTIDSASGLISTYGPGTGDVQARVENLGTNAIPVTVEAAPDSIAAVGEQRVVVDTASASSSPLTVVLLDLTSTPGDTLALAGKPVHFVTVDPPPGSSAAESFFITESGTQPGSDPHAVWLATAASGQAGVTAVRVDGQTQPDSVAIEAIATTARGDTIAGSPVRFWVLFQNR